MEISAVTRNTKILIDGKPYNVEEVEFTKPGKGRAIYRFKMRNLIDNSTLDHTYHSGEKVEEVSIVAEEHQYLYKENDHYVFMNTETFEQRFIAAQQLGDKIHFLKEGTVVTLLMMGDKPLDVVMPNFVELKLVESGMATKKETFTAQSKPAILETGAHIEVPAFIKDGDIIKVDTRTGTYVERVNKK